MKEFTVASAMEFLKQLYPDVTPRNEETLRRAIRNGELKTCKRGYGRDGNLISEADLLDFAEKYAKKLERRKQKQKGKENPLEFYPKKYNLFAKTLSDILEFQIENGEMDKNRLRLELMNAKRQWEEKRKAIRMQIQMLENELEEANTEILLLEKELDQF